MTSNHDKNNHIMWFQNSKKLLDGLNIGYILSDLDNIVLEVNDTVLAFGGWSREEFLGRKMEDFYTESDLEILRPLEKRVRNETMEVDKFYQYEFILREKSGRVFPTMVCISGNFDDNGIPVTFNNLLVDISELKSAQLALENEKNLFENVLFSIGDCVTVFSADGQMLTRNPKTSAIYGRRKKPLLSLTHDNQQNLEINVKKRKRTFDARIKGVYDENGDIFAFVETLTDITDRLELEQKNRELDRMRLILSRNVIESKMIGRSQAMQKVFELVLRCSQVDSSVLILGETGVGKEVAARSIHNHSKRKDKPFVSINCGALPDSLLESELFGHVKGAFTGAVADRDGLFREASGGTLFLDEIGDVSTQMQVKLLTVLQEREVRRLGENKTRKVDIRIIAATNKNLQQLIRQGEFREDLFYRLSVIPVHIPPLRERADDILILANHFLHKHEQRQDSPPKKLGHPAQKMLMNYSWPGNIRELENSMEYALAMSQDETIEKADLPVQIVSEKSHPIETETKSNESIEKTADLPTRQQRSWEDRSTERPVELGAPKYPPEEEKEVILTTLNRFAGNRDLTAKSLAISRVSLWRKMKKYGLSDWKFQMDGNWP